MPKIKNHLQNSFNESNIEDLLNFTKNEYRTYDPGQFLYKLLGKYTNEQKFTGDFIELVYTTLVSWNMNQRGAKLSDFEMFKKSLIEHQSQLKELFDVKMNNIGNVDSVLQKARHLFGSLNFVAEGKPKLVTFSKAMHFINPQLFMPIDRRYTLTFFYNNTYVPESDDSQFQIYWDIFEEFRLFAINNDLTKNIDDSWNRSVPKIIDNLIIAHVKMEEKKLINTNK